MYSEQPHGAIARGTLDLRARDLRDGHQDPTLVFKLNRELARARSRRRAWAGVATILLVCALLWWLRTSPSIPTLPQPMAGIPPQATSLERSQVHSTVDEWISARTLPRFCHLLAPQYIWSTFGTAKNCVRVASNPFADANHWVTSLSIVGDQAAAIVLSGHDVVRRIDLELYTFGWRVVDFQ